MLITSSSNDLMMIDDVLSSTNNVYNYVAVPVSHV